jgi:hypothetical protein
MNEIVSLVVVASILAISVIASVVHRRMTAKER